MGETADIAELLQQSTWMRRLARSLVRDDAAADDLVQETWVQALRHPPRAGETVRPWLGEVLRNVLRARFRSDGRRARREDAAVDKDSHVPSPEQLAGAVELQRRLADEVLLLDEPYRATVLMVFHQGMSPTEIATREGLPAGTVRWRLKHGLEQLRRQLDRKHAGDRKAWMRGLAPLTGERLRRALPHAHQSTAISKGALIMKMGTAIVFVAGVGVASWSFNRSTKAAQPPRAPLAQSSLPPEGTQPSRAPTRVDKTARADLLARIDHARRAAHPSSPPPSLPAAAPTLDGRYISEQIAGLVPLVQECFDNAVARHPDLQGSVVVDFSIVGDPSVGGLVGESRVIDAKSTIADKDVRECIQETMYAMKFPAPAQGGEVHVEYPFILATSSGQALTPAQLQRLDQLLESGALPDGRPLSAEERQHLEMVRSGREPLGKRVTPPIDQ